nr:PREDICTED: L-fucose kinase [Lepisosteus oculatus]
MEEQKGLQWTVVVLTCQHKDSEYVFQRELEWRQQRGLIPQGALLLTVSDPQDRLGSGGATLKALLVAAEHLSAQAGHTVVTADVLDDAHILILHTGRDFPFDGCGRAFCWLPARGPPGLVEGPLCNLDLLLHCLTHQVAPGSPPGVWVCSTDMLLHMPSTPGICWEGFSGVKVVSLPGDPSFARNHGIYITDQQDTVCDIIYRGPVDRIQACSLRDGKVPLVGVMQCFRGCRRNACVNVSAAYVPDGYYDYLTLSGDEHIRRLTERAKESRETLSHAEKPQLLSDGCCVINSILEGEVSVGSQAVVQHCHLQGPLVVQSGCLLSGIDLTSSSSALKHLTLSDIIIQGHCIRLGDMALRVFTVLGRHDNLEASPADRNATFLNRSWTEFYQRTGIQPGELWGSGDQEGAPHSLLDARLFPVFQRRGPVGLGGLLWLLGAGGGESQWRAAWRLSLRDILSCTDQQAELGWRRELLYGAARRRAKDTLQGRGDQSLLPLIRAAVLEGQQGELLSTLDSVAASSEDPGIAARTLACMADVLGCLAGREGGLRSGPAANPAWTSAFAMLERGDLPGGVRALAKERDNWLSRPHLLVRAARHYEGAAQVLIWQAVMSARRFITVGRAEIPPLEQWVEVECPARMDLSGGWSDTPPITFERGGAVVNVAVRVDGRRPIGVRARRIREPCLLLVSTSGGLDCQVTTETLCKTLQDLQDYCQPHAPGALLKAACICSGLVALPSQQPLGEQLLQRCGGGLEVRSWSDLPHGSGLGTSSILAGAVLAALYSTTGQTYDTISLIHAVLHLEQILTTGGGWQDQVGGLVGGVKLGRSQAALPLRVEVEPLSLTDDFLHTLNRHVLLLYTGKTRLARNLLQDVVRSWYSRLPAIVENVEGLVRNAEECAQAIRDGSLARVGACLDRYWQQKRAMAPGCEPATVRAMMSALRPLTLGQSLAGAGGGGFLCIITREAQQAARVKDVLDSVQGLGDFTIHTVEVDLQGISIRQPGTESD